MSAAPNASGLVATDFTPFVLQSRVPHTHNTDLFVFRLPGGADSELNLPVSSCLMARCTGADGNPVIRPYTPVNQHERGVLQLLVKRYVGGAMSSHIHSLKEGDSLDLKGPFAKLKYEANKWAHIGMLAGGTGITPMVQVLDEIFRNPSDQTRVTLLCFHTSSADVLLREKLDAYSAAHGDRFRCVFVTDKKEEGVAWVAESGYATQEMLKQYMPAPAADTLIYTCGPPAFMNVVSGDKMPDKTQGPLIGLLKEMGYDSSMVCKQ